MCCCLIIYQYRKNQQRARHSEVMMQEHQRVSALHGHGSINSTSSDVPATLIAMGSGSGGYQALPSQQQQQHQAPRVHSAAAATAVDAGGGDDDDDETETAAGESLDVQEQRQAIGGWSIRLVMFVPALCDFVATYLINVGLLWIDASIWQMIRGSELVFTALIRKLWLKRPLKLSQVSVARDRGVWKWQRRE
jgi:hypothetical protein